MFSKPGISRGCLVLVLSVPCTGIDWTNVFFGKINNSWQQKQIVCSNIVVDQNKNPQMIPKNYFHSCTDCINCGKRD